MKKILFVFSIFLTMFSCLSKDDNSPSGSDNISKCFIPMDFEYDKILSKSDVERYIKIDEGSFKADISKKGEGGYGWASYQWKSKRPDLEMEINGTKLKYPDRNIVKLSNLYFYDTGDLKTYKHDSYINLFEMGYRAISEEEYKVLFKNIEKEFANDAKGLETAKDLLEGRKKQKFQRVDGVGDSGYWKWHDTHGLQLNVLAGDTKFELTVRSSGTSEESLKLAVKLAEEILAKCK